MLNDWAKMNRMVRLTHEPTGVTTVASEYRSQHRNRAAAYARLRSKVAIGTVFPLPLRATYDFPDGEPCPDDINKHRQGGQHGTRAKARAGVGGAIVLAHRDEAGHLLGIRAAMVGQQGIKPDVWYELDDKGEFVKAGECAKPRRKVQHDAGQDQ